MLATLTEETLLHFHAPQILRMPLKSTLDFNTTLFGSTQRCEDYPMF